MQLPAEYFAESGGLPGRDVGAFLASAWPRFLAEPSDIPGQAKRISMSREEMAKRNRTWAIRRSAGGALAACAYAVLIRAEPDAAAYPAEGWSFAVDAALQSESAPNCLCLVSVTVDPACRGLGFPRFLIEAAKREAHALGFKFLLVPLRPTRKNEFPSESMDAFARRLDPGGKIFDPWLRTHVEAGTEILNACSDSVVVTASLTRWRAWTGLALDDPGEVILPGGLAPLTVDLEKGTATYREPNLWLRYRL